MDVVLQAAGRRDVPDIVALRDAVAADLLRRFGPGHWARPTRAADVLRALEHGSRVLLARDGGRAIATLRLKPRRPPEHRRWFTDVRRPLYLFDMAVAPERQRQGIGRRCIEQVLGIARAWPADAIRLDAYDAPAGAGGFYARCGFRECGRRLFFRSPIVYFERLL